MRNTSSSSFLRLPTATLSLFAAISLSGCATVHTDYDYYQNNTPDLQSADVKKFATDQQELINQFSALAGTKVPSDNGDWRPLVDAGMEYVAHRFALLRFQLASPHHAFPQV